MEYSKKEIRKKIEPYIHGGLAPQRFDLYYDTAIKAPEGGAFVECGVCNGGTLGIFAAFRSRVIWGFDSWQGNPPPEEGIDISAFDDKGHHAYEGMCKGSLTKTKQCMQEFERLPTNTHLIKGWFNETLKKHKSVIGKIAVLAIDGDWYMSIKDCLNTLYDNVMDDGYIFVTDYAYWLGANRAVHEFVANKAVTLQRPYKHCIWWNKKEIGVV